MRIRYRNQTVWRMRKKERVKVEYGRSTGARIRLAEMWWDKKNEGKSKIWRQRLKVYMRKEEENMVEEERGGQRGSTERERGE
jgi:hypothetical protein